MDYLTCKNIALKQLALDMNCGVEDFRAAHPKVVLSKQVPGQKRYFRTPHFCQMAYCGNRVVASVDPSFYKFMNDYVSAYESYRCFDTPQLMQLNAELKNYSKCVGHLAEYYVPDERIPVKLNPAVELVVYCDEAIHQWYDDERFSMALSYKIGVDKIAVAGYIDGELAGIAGASADCKTMWQVGIDVLPLYRGMGVGTTLTKVLTDEILKRGIVPFYGCAWSNLSSKKLALIAGYKLAWIEGGAIDMKQAENYLSSHCFQEF